MAAVRNAGPKGQPPHYRFETAAYEQLQVIYVSSGELYFNEDTLIGPGAAALLREGGAFTLHTRARPYGGVFFISRGEERPEFRGPALALAADAEMRELARMMARELAAPGEGSGEVLLGLGQALAWRSLRLAGRPGARVELQEHGRYWAEVARQALEVTLFTGKTAREALAPLGLSYRQLARHFSASLGVSPKRYQIRARVREARRLLAETKMRVTAVAGELGYPSSQHFATQFLREAGSTPSAFRARSTGGGDHRGTSGSGGIRPNLAMSKTRSSG
jgi:AraC-like DNA-binding protein